MFGMLPKARPPSPTPPGTALGGPTLSEWMRVLGASAEMPATGLEDAALIDAIRRLEDVKSACAAVQARLALDLRDAQVDQAEQAVGSGAENDGRDPAKVAAHKRAEAIASTASQVALARRESPVAGNRHLGMAMALAGGEMPHTYAALTTGRLSEWRATLLVRETACLSVTDRREVDARIAADTGRCEGWGNRRLVAEAKKIAVELDAESVVARARRATTERRVTLRPAPDTMSYLTALLPVAHGVAVYAALTRHADSLRSTGDPRSRGQIMADTLLERVTGRPAEAPVSVELNLTMTSTALFDPGAGGGAEAAWLDGYGVVPADWACEHIAAACTDTKTSTWVRRVFTHPVTGAVLATDARARTAPPGLARLIRTRDQLCRTPFCDAPIRHLDHVTTHALGGVTSAENLQGLCERCNHTKQAPGWRSQIRSGTGRRHEVLLHTPTGHSYGSTAPALPGTPVSSPLEQRLRDILWRTGPPYLPAA